jgi:probable F420-dependent oxidoreductase
MRPAPPLRCTVSLPSFGPFFRRDELHRVVDLARMAEASGIDSVNLPDHVVMGPNTGAYRWGPFPFPEPGVPWLEPLTVIAAMSAVTRHLRFLTWILIVPLRTPAVLAKTAATIDVLSRGRLDLGVGIGWQKEEFDAAAVPFQGRGKRMEEILAACRALWTREPADFASDTVSFEKIDCSPKPVQAGGIPIWFSGTLTERTLDRIVRLGDGWIPIMGERAPGIADGVARLRERFKAAGRDPSQLRVAGAADPVRGEDGRPSLAKTLERIPRLREAGVDLVHVPLLPFCRQPDQAPAFFQELGRRLEEYR